MTNHELIRFLARLNEGVERIQDASYIEYTETYIMPPYAVSHLRDTLETLKGKQAMIDKDYEDKQDLEVNKLFVAQLHNFSIVTDAELVPFIEKTGTRLDSLLELFLSSDKDLEEEQVQNVLEACATLKRMFFYPKDWLDDKVDRILESLDKKSEQL